jgi:pimeloyl-ACP methyl ester carboxylesterase
VTAGVLATAIRAVHPAGPGVLVGHSLGRVAALALLEADAGWAGTLILEEPPSLLAPEDCLTLADGLDADVHWAVQGIAQMDPVPFARRLRALADDASLRLGTPDRVLAVAPGAHVLAARDDRSLLEGGSALAATDRDALAARLPPGHVIAMDGGHRLHRDAPDEWLAAVASVIG